MSKNKKADAYQQQFWQMVLETFKSSKLSVRQFCQQEGLTESAFYSWRKKLTASSETTEDEQKDMSSSAFIEVAMPKNDTVVLELILSSGNTLKINPGTDNKTLTNVLSALCEVGLC